MIISTIDEFFYYIYSKNSEYSRQVFNIRTNVFNNEVKRLLLIQAKKNNSLKFYTYFFFNIFVQFWIAMVAGCIKRNKILFNDLLLN